VFSWSPLPLSVGSVILFRSFGGSWHPALCLGLSLGASQTRLAFCLALHRYYPFLVLIYFVLYVSYSYFIKCYLTHVFTDTHSLIAFVLVLEDSDTARWCTYRPVVDGVLRRYRWFGPLARRLQPLRRGSGQLVNNPRVYVNRPYYYNYSLFI